MFNNIDLQSCRFLITILVMWREKICFLLDSSFGSLGTGWMWWLMTVCLSETGSCFSFTQRREQSFGAPWWRRRMPSKKAFMGNLETRILFACVMCLLLCMWQVEWLLWGSVRRLHVWGVWGLHRRSDRDVWAEKSSNEPLQHHQKSCGERLSHGLLHRR